MPVITKSKPTKLSRADWELRFACHIVSKGGVPPKAVLHIVKAELESWPESEGEWKNYVPEDAADEQLSYWTD